MDKHLFRGTPDLFLVRLDRKIAEILSRGIAQVEVARLRRVPRTEGAFEDDAITGIEEHLGGATGILFRPRGRIFLVNEAEIADPLADVGDLPRPASDLVKDAGAEVPGNLRLTRDLP